MEQPPPQTTMELLLDLEFSIRQHIAQKTPTTQEMVKGALHRLDLKRNAKKTGG